MASAVLNYPRIYQCSNEEAAPADNKKFNEYIVLDLNEAYSFHNCRSILYKVLEIASIVAFIAVAILSLIPCIEAPGFLPVVIFSVLMSLPHFFHAATKPLELTHKNHERKAQFFKDAKAEFEKLPDDKEELRAILKKEMNIDLNEVQSEEIKDEPKILKSAIARYRANVNKEKEILDAAEELEKSGKNEETYEENIRRKLKILELQEDDLTAIRVELAWIHHILRQPSEQKSSTDYLEIFHDFKWRAISQRLGDPEYDNVIKLKNGEVLTKAQLDDLPTIRNLSLRLYA